jgi:hypothetical protein
MTTWEEDKQTGLTHIPMTLINDFKLDEEYQQTLTTHGPHLFSANQRGYRILYHNMWGAFGNYEGRICINELQKPLAPGQYHALSYFSRIVQIAMHRHAMNPENRMRPYIDFLIRVIERHADSSEIDRWLALSNWNQQDEYTCIRMTLQDRDIQTRIIVQTCHHIEATIPSCYAFLYKEEIAIIVNLTVSNMSFSDCISKLAIITREGLFKTGFSTPYNHFIDTPDYFLQAGIALEYGIKNDSMFWNYQFEQFALQYIRDQITKELPARQIVSQKLLKLKEYDVSNHTDLYETLHRYLEYERNAVQTANALYIHRSTLFYRLNRIKALLDMNLDLPENRLYLQLSYYLLEQDVES